MICYETFARLKNYTDKVGVVYGTEDFCIYLYALVKMTKPKTVLELGTGFGSTALWAGMGLKENGQGTITTIDNGSEWPLLDGKEQILGEWYRPEYDDFIHNLIKQFNLQKQINFLKPTTLPVRCNNIDMLFCDYAHGPFDTIKFIADYLAKMSENSYIFIDSASTYFPSYSILESTVEMLNTGRIPQTLGELVSIVDRDIFEQKIRKSKFELTHIIENKNRRQNSTVQLKIQPLDIMPQPRIGIRF